MTMDRMLARRMQTPYTVINPGTQNAAGDIIPADPVGEIGYLQYHQKLVRSVSGEEVMSSCQLYTSNVASCVTIKSRVRFAGLELPVLAVDSYGQAGESHLLVIYL